MAQQVCVVVNSAEREQLAAIAADRNQPRKRVERARIVLASAQRHSAQRVSQHWGQPADQCGGWQLRFAESGVDGLLRDKTRKPGTMLSTPERNCIGGRSKNTSPAEMEG